MLSARRDSFRIQSQWCAIHITVTVLKMSEDDASADGISDSQGTTVMPVRYRPNMFSTSAGRRSRVVLQTSDSSGEDDESPPRSKARSEVSRVLTSTPTARPSRLPYVSRSGPAVFRSTLHDATNRSLSGGSHIQSGKENVSDSAQSRSFSGIEKVLLETNQLLKHVIKRVDKCEKQMKSFESKLDEVTTCSSSTSAASTPSHKKLVPEEVRVSVLLY